MMVTNRIEQNRVNVISLDAPQHQETTRKREKKNIAFTRDEKTDLPNVKGEVKRAIKATFAHLCTSLTRDKCLPLPAVKGESSGDKGRFCHAFNPYLRRKYISLAFVTLPKASSNMS